MKNQLELTHSELLEIGFKFNAVYEIPILNGFFYYNPSYPENRWYQKIIIGRTANFICLDIKSRPELYTLLQAFSVKFNMVLK